ncbi:MAG: XrtA system polysaccharide deacetylase [Pseudomonadota bacterium]
MASPLNALSFDVEDYFQVSAFNDAIRRDSWDQHRLRVSRNTEVLLELLDRHGVKATFYTLGWIAERAPELVRAIAAAGHEVASHGYSHKLVYHQTRNEFRDETRRTRALLEDLAGQPVTSYRAASYSITEASLWALEILQEEGFTTDSSIFPIAHDRYGLMGGPLEPHYLALRNGARLLEFPISTLRRGGLNLPVSGGGYFRIYPYAMSRYLARQVNAEGRPFVFYLHPWEVDPDQPRVSVGALARFRHYTNLARTHARLDRLLQDFRFTTVSDCLREHYGHEPELRLHDYHRRAA